ncbi:right-handed parallel beta-helix repeat-containing protein [Bacillus sp. ISL-46]|uniref:right-handed parallel beta-helix repeat-containing protein n=1 Tax=Bacillus sp. ISL-46 TaxID=2819129 RepID=UPI001BEC11EF|nr:right-handed parallel beta-helix repeat-containing protein [Bacillus sp. ISL-46]MBT2721974.1 right-handed parallel beta-helix repeat-containing protein [Bacillus sp. ISL-46]
MKKCFFKVVITISLLLFLFPVNFFNSFVQVHAEKTKLSVKYTLELSRWGIYNDATHAVETTKGLNQALKWAYQQGYSTFVVPDGTYLVSKDGQINMVSNMDFQLGKGTVLQKEANSNTGYILLYMGPGVHNVSLKGGTYKGDKETHDYNMIKSTHEGGYGIVTSGASDVTIDGIKSIHFTGDGLAVGSMGKLIKEFYAKSFVPGSVNSKGKLTKDSTKMRIEKIPLTDRYFKIQNTFQFLHQQNMPTKDYTAYFYKADGTFITSLNTKEVNKPVGWGLMDIPKNAAYFNAVFNTPYVPNNVYIEFWMQGVSKNVTVKNSEFSFNRRQGITVGGAKDTAILNNKIHDMKGTAPQSGIDVEAGYNLNNQIEIKGNKFYNNQAYDLILYDGRNAIVEDNSFYSKSIGLAISEPFKYAKVKNNTFKDARIYIYNDAIFNSNKMDGGMAAFLGNNILINDMEFKDTLVNLASSTPFGIEASNITIKNTKNEHTQFGVNRNPIHLKNVTITGQAALDSFGGNAADGSTFDHLKVIGYTRIQLPKGTYNNCEFEAAKGKNGVEVSNTGHYEFHNCKFTSFRGGFETNKVHGLPDTVVIKNSTIKVLGDNSPGVSVQAGKTVILENNIIETGSFPYKTNAIIQVGDYWKRDSLSTVSNLTIKGNTIRSSEKGAVGVSTIYAGKNALSYLIENNKIFHGKLELKTNDIKRNNKLQ